MMHLPDPQLVLKQVRELAHEQPDRITDCVYYNEEADTPVCIVGHALHALGFPIVEEFDMSDRGTFIDALYHERNGITGDEDVCELQSIQAAQDAGVAWGMAVGE